MSCYIMLAPSRLYSSWLVVGELTVPKDQSLNKVGHGMHYSRYSYGPPCKILIKCLAHFLYNSKKLSPPYSNFTVTWCISKDVLHTLQGCMCWPGENYFMHFDELTLKQKHRAFIIFAFEKAVCFYLLCFYKIMIW